MNVYSGQLARLASSAQDRVLPAPSPRHAVAESDDSFSQQERTVPANTGAEFAGSQFEPDNIPGGGMSLDTPVSWARDLSAEASRIKYAASNPHDSQAVLTMRQADMPDGGRLSAHDGSVDHGWRRSMFSGEPLTDDIQQREADRTDGYSNPFGAAGEPNVTKYLRGRSSLAENNPDGFRQGVLQRWQWDNPRRRTVTRDYGIQLTQPRDSYTAPARQTMVKDMVTAAALPRSAGSFDDAIMSGNDTNAVTTGSSSFGGF